MYERLSCRWTASWTQNKYFYWGSKPWVLLPLKRNTQLKVCLIPLQSKSVKLSCCHREQIPWCANFKSNLNQRERKLWIELRNWTMYRCAGFNTHQESCFYSMEVGPLIDSLPIPIPKSQSEVKLQILDDWFLYIKKLPANRTINCYGKNRLWTLNTRKTSSCLNKKLPWVLVFGRRSDGCTSLMHVSSHLHATQRAF